MNTELLEKAKRLYFQTDLSKTEIANTLGIPRRTLHHWIKENNWQYQKQSAAHMPVLIAENCYHILANYTELLGAPDRKGVLISFKEADTIHKLIVTIGKIKTQPTLNENMEMFTRFTDAVSSRSPEMARAIAPYIGDYIASGAAESVSVAHKFHTPRTLQEMSAEEQLDHQYALEDTIPHPSDVIGERPAMLLAGERQAAASLRRTRPSYTDLLASLRGQDENIRHMFPAATGHIHRAAA